MSATFSAKIEGADPEKIRDFLERLGFTFSETAHAHFSARGDDAHVTLYRSGKIVVQGKGGAGTWEYLGAMGFVGAPAEGGAKKSGPHKSRPPRMGGDECGKGDYFGPLVVATCRVSAEVEEKLVAKGVQDSKRIGDRKIVELARTVRRIADVRVLSLGPAAYNRLQGKMGNVNRMLAWAHARVIEDMLEAHPREKLAIVDQFARPDVLQRALMTRGRKIEVVQEVRAESDPAVAAASIVARDRFLSDLERLSERVGFKLPKGATSVIPAARRAVKEHGSEILDEIAKVHFRTTQKVLAG